MIVYALFSADGDGDGYVHFDLVCVALSIDAAKSRRKPRVTTGVRSVHASMTEENGWTCVGNRSDCQPDLDGFGGFIIEPMEVVTMTPPAAGDAP